MAKKQKQSNIPEEAEFLDAEMQEDGEDAISEEALRYDPKPVQIKRVAKGSRLFTHDLYKLEVANFQKNLSWKAGQPNLVPVQHVHFYHSHNSRGKPLDSANLQNGHTHKVTVEVDAEGNLIGKCGPPIKLVKKQLRSGRVLKQWRPVQFLDETQYDDTGESKLITDDHRHVITYMHSEELSDAKLKAIHDADKKKLQNLARHPQSQAAPIQAKKEDQTASE